MHHLVNILESSIYIIYWMAVWGLTELILFDIYKFNTRTKIIIYLCVAIITIMILYFGNIYAGNIAV